MEKKLQFVLLFNQEIAMQMKKSFSTARNKLCCFDLQNKTQLDILLIYYSVSAPPTPTKGNNSGAEVFLLGHFTPC